jgi:hypothetical protein
MGPGTREIREKRERWQVEVAGERVECEARLVDARGVSERQRDAHRGRPEGHLPVLLPGHGLTVDGPKRLVDATALLSRSKMAWCVDPVPAKGGDRVEALALARILREKVYAAFPKMGEGSTGVTIAGWSHGGAEALRAAAADPALFPQFLGLCPAGLVAQSATALVSRFFGEGLSLLWAALRHGDGRALREIVRVGTDVLRGLVHDLLRSGSLKRLIEDVRWAGKKVIGEGLDYPSQVAILMGQDDTVIRWREVFPGCQDPTDLAGHLDDFRRRGFPRARRVEVAVVKGNHLSPETDAPAFVRLALAMLGEGDEPAAGLVLFSKSF